MRHHFHDDNDQRDALNDYLDAHTGFAPADSRADEVDPDMRECVEEFLDLAERAGAIPRAHSQPGRPAMNTTLPTSGTVAGPTRTNQRKRRDITLPTWTRHLHMVSTVLLIAAVAALSFVAFGPNGIGNGDGNGTGDGPGQFAAVPVATVPDDAETSSIPYPSFDECEVEPMTRDEIIQHLNEANVATMPDHPKYEVGIEPSVQEAEAIMHVFRQDQACGQRGGGFQYTMQFQSPWYIANMTPIFRTPDGGNLRPVSDEVIEDYADVLVTDHEEATPMATIGTPPPMPTQPARLPIPDDGTPVVHEGGGGSPTIAPEDIVITGPDTAIARAYFVNETTREVSVSTPLTYGFVNVDGQWLFDSYSEGSRG